MCHRIIARRFLDSVIAGQRRNEKGLEMSRGRVDSPRNDGKGRFAKANRPSTDNRDIFLRRAEGPGLTQKLRSNEGSESRGGGESYAITCDR